MGRGNATAEDLIAAVTKHCSDEHIVSSGSVRFEFETGRLNPQGRGMRRTEWNGGPFQAAIDFACQDGDLHRWKRQYGGGVGWSLTSANCQQMPYSLPLLAACWALFQTSSRPSSAIQCSIYSWSSCASDTARIDATSRSWRSDSDPLAQSSLATIVSSAVATKSSQPRRVTGIRRENS